MTTRLINLDELLKELEEWEADLYDTNPKRQLGVTDAIVIASQMPTVDAIPISFIEERRMTDKPYYKDGILLAYIEGFYQAKDDHERALYGAYIVGSLETMFSNFLDNSERKEE